MSTHFYTQGCWLLQQSPCGNVLSYSVTDTLHTLISVDQIWRRWSDHLLLPCLHLLSVTCWLLHGHRTWWIAHVCILETRYIVKCTIHILLQKWWHFGYFSQLRRAVWGFRRGFNDRVRMGFSLSFGWGIYPWWLSERNRGIHRQLESSQR